MFESYCMDLNTNVCVLDVSKRSVTVGCLVNFPTSVDLLKKFNRDVRSRSGDPILSLIDNQDELAIFNIHTKVRDAVLVH